MNSCSGERTEAITAIRRTAKTGPAYLKLWVTAIGATALCAATQAPAVFGLLVGSVLSAQDARLILLMLALVLSASLLGRQVTAVRDAEGIAEALVHKMDRHVEAAESAARRTSEMALIKA